VLVCVHTGAIWRIRLNDPRSAAIRVVLSRDINDSTTGADLQVSSVIIIIIIIIIIVIVIVINITLSPEEVRSIVISMSVCLYALAYLEHHTAKFHQIFCASCLGSFLARWNMSCTSGFVNDVVLSHMGHVAHYVYS